MLQEQGDGKNKKNNGAKPRYKRGYRDQIKCRKEPSKERI